MDLAPFIPGIEKALEHAGETHTVGDVVRNILAGQAQLWCEDQALIVTEIHETPRTRIVHFWLATGEKNAVVALSNRVIEWAREQGCSRATLAGRRGWLRVLAPEGWTSGLTLLERGI